jgi:16S rRNA (adenine1518-N6/adenine1519-N6)-dimethyltransferase
MAKIAIVNEDDEVIGTAEKSEARQNGQIHRLVRILLCDAEGKILLQKRHPLAKDSPGRWDFSAAGHVDEGEDYEAAAQREMHEELGLGTIKLKPLFTFYAEKDAGGVRLRRFNTVFLGQVDPDMIRPNLAEIGGVDWFTKSQVAAMIRTSPDDFSTGLKETYGKIMSYMDS